jgi:hypothetical protein
MLLERPIGRVPESHHEISRMSTLVVFTALPVSHWYNDWAKEDTSKTYPLDCGRSVGPGPVGKQCRRIKKLSHSQSTKSSCLFVHSNETGGGVSGIPPGCTDEARIDLNLNGATGRYSIRCKNALNSYKGYKIFIKSVSTTSVLLELLPFD